MKRLLFSMFAAVVMTALAPISDQEASPTSVQAVLQAWRSRQDRIRSVHFLWTQHHFQAKGTQAFPETTNGKTRLVYQPPSNMEQDISKELLLEGNKMRYWMRSKEYSTASKSYVEHEHLSLFDGKTSWIVTPPGAKPYTTAGIRRENRNADAVNLYVQPILTWCRGCDSGSGLFIPSNLQVSSKSGIIDGAKCLLLEGTEGPETKKVFWVDPASDYHVKRITISRNDYAIITLDVKYESVGQGAESMSVPNAWRMTWLKPDGSLRESSHSIVTKAEINPVVSAKAFAPELAEGSLIVDQRGKQPALSLVKADGRTRPVLPTEYEATHEQLLHSEPGMAFAVKHSVPTVVLLTVLAGVLIIIGTATIYRWRSRARVTQG